MAKYSLAEVFGFAVDDFSEKAQYSRMHHLCPFNNRVPLCTKDKANNPLGVCSIREGENIAITCPVRFRQDWQIAVDAATFFFPKDTAWAFLTEVRLNDQRGKSAGNIDLVIVAYDNQGNICDFGAVEIQSVYISGNIRDPFEYYMHDPGSRYMMDWGNRSDNPRPDYLSSSRKRLAPQLIYKGGILQSWRKKLAVAIHSGFYRTLPVLPEVPSDQADVVWLVYDLQRTDEHMQYKLCLTKTVYTQFVPALQCITSSEPGSIEVFVQQLQRKFNTKKQDKSFPLDG